MIIYQYKKGAGWVPTLVGRVFTFKGKRWLITEVEECYTFELSWRTSDKIMQMTNEELDSYAGHHWWGRSYPGLDAGWRKAGLTKLYVFTEVK